MIDKLAFHTQDFLVKDISLLNGWQVIANPIVLGDAGIPEINVILNDAKGVVLTGSKCFKNSDLFQATFKNGHLFVQMNPSKPYHPFNLVESEKILLERVNIVIKQLQDFGIVANFPNSRLNRVDLTKNAVMNEPVPAYAEIMRLFNAKRSSKQALYPEGYSSGNKQWGYVVYDKGLECLQNGHNTEQRNLMRVEVQLKKNESIRHPKRLGIETLSDMMNFSFTELEVRRRTILRDDVFRIPDNLPDNRNYYSSDQLKNLALELKEEYPRSFMKKFLEILTTHQIADYFHSIDQFKLFVEEITENRMTANRTINNYRRNLQMQSQLLKSENNSISNLLNELINKFAA